MEEYTQITIDQWVQWKEDIRRKLQETAQNFVHIGYRLKQIRDSGMYGGEADIFSFAEKEYGLGKSTVSRFIAINEKYSEGGNSLELKAEYRGFSSSKLSEMLTLPDSECQLITEKTTIKEIRDLKEFNREEAEEKKQASGQMSLEEMAQESGQQTSEERSGQQEYTPIQKCIIDFFKDKKECLNKLMRRWIGEGMDEKYAVELINPSGQKSHQKGIVYLVMYDLDGGVKYRQMGDETIRALTWTEFLHMIFGIYNREVSGTDFYSAFYQVEESKEEPKEESIVATSQQTGGSGSETETEQITEEREGGQDGESEMFHGEVESDGQDESTENAAGSSPESVEEPDDNAVAPESGDGETGAEGDSAEGVPADPGEDGNLSKATKELIDEIRFHTDRVREMMNNTDAPSWRMIKGRLRAIMDRVDVLIRYPDMLEQEEKEDK